MPRQLQLTQNLLDRAATVWNVVYSTVSFLINFPSHFEAFVKWIDSLDPSQALASSKIGAYSRDFDKGGASRSDGVTRLDDELLVPAKPFGFLAAALNEYEPARPEVHRSRVRPDPRRSLLARVSFRGESLLRGEPVRGA